MESEPLRVLHIAPTPFFADRGCHIRIRNELEALQPYPVQALVCTYHLGRDPGGLEVRRIWRIPGYRKLDAGYSPFRFPADILLFFLVLRTCWRQRPHVLHGHLHEGALIGWAVRTCMFWRRTALVMDMQGSLSGELVSYGTLKSRLLTRVVGLVEGLICRLPDFFFCSSRESRNTLLRRFRVAPEKTALLQDVVPGEFFASADSRALRRHHDLPLEKKIIIYTGSLLPGKGVAHLFEAMRILLEARDDLFFVLVGYPVDEARAFVGRYGLADRVRLPGQVAYGDLAAWLGTGDVAVEPKEDDSGEASGKLLHYLAAGLPVACFDTANNRSFLGECGFYASSMDGAGLARAISAALADPALARRRGEAGREQVRGTYSMEAVGKTLLASYRRLAGRR
ncbi:MAG TPA: glycosyltransferase family 1 protein [Desulfobulbus sp.]|nr:glycosyltransferase family 1 protein [Desulfobulbus sp.]